MGPTLLGCISPFHQTQESPECPVGFPWDIPVLTQWLLGGLCFSCSLAVGCTNSLCSAHQPKVLFYPTASSGTAVPGKGGLWLGGDISHGLSLLLPEPARLSRKHCGQISAALECKSLMEKSAFLLEYKLGIFVFSWFFFLLDWIINF